MNRQVQGMVTALVSLSIMTVTACSNDPGKPEIVAQLRLAQPLPVDGEATVQLLPQRASAGLPVFNGTAPVAAGATEVTVTVGYERAAESVAYRISARIDGPGILLLGRQAEAPALDADGARVRLALDPP
ncbi:MAG: hypothetical protein RIK00_02315 [Algiphilus sp.]|uniref:hypothetical protein n=1 Tax=Algiphilus sp. TaxID=1872431 RepID=UPI001CA6FFB2|nr:hypothetical protein [Algiphilus sp.]MBY8965891.1 hypothetical protein [Algiphilus acroporae]MCI5062690.1 hypothetical protein [Algiphilus sp.]MCI5104146.1 hypothetical protein [Algiphilus sp.]